MPLNALTGRFQYTGQQWLAEFGMQYSRARIYSPTLGRFLQTDPIGHGGGMNLYGYVRGDPVNLTDPLGLQEPDCPVSLCGEPPVVRARCFEGLSEVNGVCVPNNIELLPNLNTLTTFTFVVTGTPDISPDTGCTAQGSIVTCPIQPQCRSDETTVSNDQRSGPVFFGSLGGEGYIALGGGIFGGAYYDSGTGARGVFGSGESTAIPGSGSVGYGGSLGAQVGVATNLSSFAGNYSVIGAGYGPIAVNYTFARGDILAPISLSIGPAVNVIPVPLYPVSAHFSQGRTSLASQPLTNLRSC